MAANTEKGMVNPFLHIHVHLIVEKQIRNGDPPEVGNVAGELYRRGMDRHMIIHTIGVVFLEELYNMIKQRRPFDQGHYVRELSKIITDDGTRQLN